MLKRLCLATLVAFLSASSAQAAAQHSYRTHVDRKAGVKFVVPFRSPRLLRGAQIEAAVRQQLGDRFPDDIRYTSGVYAEGSVPSVVVWIKKVDGGVSRQLADALQGDRRVQAALGFRDFKFDKETLRGEGDLPEQNGLKGKVLLQLVRDRYTFVGFYYKTAAQLRDFETIRKTMKVGRLSHLNYAELPAVPAGEWHSWLAVLGWLAGAGAVGTAVYLINRGMRRLEKPVLAAAGEAMHLPEVGMATAAGGEEPFTHGPEGIIPIG